MPTNRGCLLAFLHFRRRDSHRRKKPIGGRHRGIANIDEKGNFVRSELRFILAQDTGSAIIGSGHIDLYMGEGETGRKRIEFMNQSGRVWLLLPKEASEKKLLAQNL